MTVFARPVSTLAALCLGISLLVTVPAVAADFHGLGCFRDPVGDAGGVDAVDIEEVCVSNPDSGTIRVLVAVVGTIDPEDDPAWANDDTALTISLSGDGDATAEVMMTLRQGAEGTPMVFTVDGDGDSVDCGEMVQWNGSLAIFQFEGACLGTATSLATGVAYTYEVTEGQAVAMDRYQDDGSFTPIVPVGDSPPFCDNHSETGDEVIVARLRCGGLIEGTEPVSQAIAISQFVFDRLDTPVIDPYQGEWAVIVRDDNFADALAGSSLGFGQAPLLFTYSPTSGPQLGQDHTRLAAATRQELLRTVPRGFTVYVLGGTAAIDEGVAVELRGLGYDVQRLSGRTRDETAAAVSAEVRRRVAKFKADTPSFTDINMVLVANRDNWPDAVLAGQIGAFWGMPVLLTGTTERSSTEQEEAFLAANCANVDPGGPPPTPTAPCPIANETLAAIDAIRPTAIHYIGGSGVISTAMVRYIRAYAENRGYARGLEGVAAPGEAPQDGEPVDTRPWRQFCTSRSSADEPLVDDNSFWTCRQAGAERNATGAAVSQLGRELIQRFGDGEVTPTSDVYVAAVPLDGDRTANTYAYVLAASMMSGRFGGAVFMPTTDQTIHPTVVSAVCTEQRGEFIRNIDLVAAMADTDRISDGFIDQILNLINGGCP